MRVTAGGTLHRDGEDLSMLPTVLRLSAFVALVILRASAQCGPEWQPGDPLPQLRGTVAATQVWDPDGAGPSPSVLVVCGRFDAGHSVATNLATWDGTQWGTLPGTPSGDLRAMCVWNGQLAVAGSAIWTFDGTTWTNLGAVTGSAGHASAIVVYQNSLCVVGPFTAVGGWPANHVAAYTGTGWVGLGGGFGSGAPSAVTVFNGLLYVGGNLVPGGGSAVAHLQAWNGTTWTPVGLWNGPIETLAVRNGTSLANSYLYAGGSFTVINGTLVAPLVARFSPSTNSWAAQGSLAVASGATTCTRLFVRGTGISSFEVTAGCAGANNHLGWRWTGTTWTSLGYVPGGVVVTPPTAIAHYGGEYLVGIAPAPGDAPSSLYRLSGAWQAVQGLGIDGEVAAVGSYAGEPVISGDFSGIDGVPISHIARGRPGNWQALGSGLAGGHAYAFATLPNGDLIAAGSFTSAGGVAAAHIARWDGVGWHALGAGTNAVVLDVAVAPTGDLFAAGGFTTAGGQPANRIARWDGAQWHALGSGVNAALGAVVVLANGDVVVGGALYEAGGVPAGRVARWDGSAWHALGAGFGGPLSQVSSLAVAPNGDIVACGRYMVTIGQPANHVARWDGTVWSLLPGPPAGQWSAPLLRVAALPDGSLVVGGYLQDGGPSIADSALWRRAAGAWSSLAVDDNVFGMSLAADGELLLAGSFEHTGAEVAVGFGAMLPGCAPAAPAYGTGCAGAGGPDVLTATTLPWDNATLRTRATGLPPLCLALVVYGFSQLSVPIVLLLPEGLPGCDLLVAPDILGLVVAAGGVLDSEVFIAPSPSLVGATFYHQVLPIELGGGGQVTGITATNGLALTVGSY